MRYNYQDGVTDYGKKRGPRIVVVLIVLVLTLLLGLYAAVVYFAPGMVSIPFTSIGTNDATAKKMKATEPGAAGDRLFIPQLNVELSIKTGDTAALQEGAWQRSKDIGNPDKGGNFALSALHHSWDWNPITARVKSPFYNLHKLQPGDELYVDYQGQRYAYKVTSKFDIQTSMDRLEKELSGNKLTLYACDKNGFAAGGEAVEAEQMGTVSTSGKQEEVFSL